MFHEQEERLNQQAIKMCDPMFYLNVHKILRNVLYAANTSVFILVCPGRFSSAATRYSYRSRKRTVDILYIRVKDITHKKHINECCSILAQRESHMKIAYLLSLVSSC